MPYQSRTYSFTTVTQERRRVFQRELTAQLMMDMLFHYRDEGRYLLHGFAIMPDHIHVLLTPSEGQTIERCAQCIKGGFSHALKSRFPGQIWQRGFHEHLIRNEEDFAAQMQYIANNPNADSPFVHTKHCDRIDAMPAYFRG